MNSDNFNSTRTFSNSKISKIILEIETKLFNLRLKKATRQNFKVHEIKNLKRRLAQLKTL